MRLIDADAANVNDIACYYGSNCRVEDVEEWLKDQPTIDAVPVVHGQWVHLGGDEWYCSACGNVIHTEGSWEKPDENYCPNCGADMRGE